MSDDMKAKVDAWRVAHVSAIQARADFCSAERALREFDYFYKMRKDSLQEEFARFTRESLAERQTLRNACGDTHEKTFSTEAAASIAERSVIEGLAEMLK